jgi:hypothetical protein
MGDTVPQQAGKIKYQQTYLKSLETQKSAKYSLTKEEANYGARSVQFLHSKLS